MNPQHHYVRVTEATGKVNAIQVYVDHQKNRGGIMLGMMGVMRKEANEEWEGSFPSASFIMFDPVHKMSHTLLEPATRLNRKKVADWNHLIEACIERRRSGTEWDVIAAFAQGMGFTMVESVTASA